MEKEEDHECRTGNEVGHFERLIPHFPDFALVRSQCSYGSEQEEPDSPKWTHGPEYKPGLSKQGHDAGPVEHTGVPLVDHVVLPNIEDEEREGVYEC